MQAATPATENARRRPKVESTLEAKLKKDLEWEVPRHTLLELDNEVFCVQQEKALMQATTPATENARRRPKVESTLEAKLKKDLEWEVPRHTLLE
nr:hypothetical protein [Tanacetum cinerariifolium]